MKNRMDAGMWVGILLLSASPAWSQSSDFPIHKAKRKYETLLQSVPGFLEVGIGGINGEFHLIVRVDSASSKRVVLKRVGEDADGFKVFVQVSEGSNSGGIATTKAPQKSEPHRCPNCSGGSTVSDESNNIWRTSVTDCDIIRDYLRMKPVSHKAGNGFYFTPCQLILRSQVGAGGGHSYTYTKHREDCPIRLGRVSQPSWSDNYIAWVFQSGYTPAARGSFLYPTELKASDKLWRKQASEDLMTRLRYIREGAEWTSTPTTRPGMGWGWKDPTTSGGYSDPAPVPTGGGSGG